MKEEFFNAQHITKLHTNITENLNNIYQNKHK